MIGNEGLEAPKQPKREERFRWWERNVINGYLVKYPFDLFGSSASRRISTRSLDVHTILQSNGRSRWFHGTNWQLLQGRIDGKLPESADITQVGDYDGNQLTGDFRSPRTHHQHTPMRTSLAPRVLGTALGACSIAGLTINQRTSSDDDKKKASRHDVALYLTDSSKAALKKYLMSVKDVGDIDVSRVVIRRSCTAKDSFEYEPLFGERAAFRLKGLARTDNGLIVVSTVL